MDYKKQNNNSRQNNNPRHNNNSRQNHFAKQNETIIDAFMAQQSAPEAGSRISALTTDGQSLYSYELRIAEYVPVGNTKAIIVYDYTHGGGNYISHNTSGHVSMIKRRVPRSNVMKIDKAKSIGLVK